MEPIVKIEGLVEAGLIEPGARRQEGAGASFVDTLESAIGTVDRLQRESESVQQAYARNEPIDLHEVLIKIEEAEIAFKTMMEVRNKLIDSYREIMRMGS